MNESFNQKQLLELSESVGRLLLERDETLAVAESCTGGWMSKVITDIAGSSKWFSGGLVTYSNELKMNLLGVSQQTLNINGAVSARTVEEMAVGTIKHCHTDWGIAVSGIAGPGGGREDKPVGTVYIAWAYSHHLLIHTRVHFPGDRDNVRRLAVIEALSGLKEQLGQTAQ